jgi:hypothetical protein
MRMHGFWQVTRASQWPPAWRRANVMRGLRMRALRRKRACASPCDHEVAQSGTITLKTSGW